MRQPRLLLAPIALATLLLMAAQPAHAQDAPATVQMSIPQMPLAQALNEFARQANLSMSFPADKVAGKTAPAVSGRLGVRQALKQLLAGSGLRAEVSGTTVIVTPGVEPPPPGPDAQRPETDLPAMTVTASGFKESVTKAAASITVISHEQLQKKTYFSVIDVLKDVPGIYVSGSAGSEEITMRGMASDYTLILVDGQKVDVRESRSDTTVTGYQMLPGIEAIDHIEIIRGPASSLYGSDAMGGVINIITKKTSGNGWHGSVSTSAIVQENSRYGNTFQGSVHLSGPLIANKLSMKFDGTAQQRNEDNYDGGSPKQKIENGAVGFTWTPDTQNVVDLDISRATQDRLATDKTAGIASNHLYSRDNYSIRHEGDYGFIETNSYIQVEESTNSYSNISGRNITFNTIEKMPLGKSHVVSFGGMFLNEEIDDANNVIKTDSGDPASSLDRNSWALFAEDRWTVLTPFDIVPSVRYDQSDTYGAHFTPKIYGIWTVNPQWTVKGGVSGGYKNPTLRQSAANWADSAGSGQRDGVSVGNPDLKPETSTNFELSANWEGNTMKAGVTGFYSKFRNKIELSTLCTGDAGSYGCEYNGQAYDFVSSYYNVSKAMMRGIEATFSWNILPSLHLNTSYTYTQTKQQSGAYAGQPLNQQPKHLLSARMDWEFSRHVDPWLRVYYRGATSEHYAGNSRSSETAGYPAYTLVDLGVDFKFSKKLRVNVGVYNLLNRYIDSDTYGVNLDGRNYQAKLTYAF
ncbi:TonB-dependent receptor [Paraburkholderia tropica]|uniref:TonB-dependent receptor n=1 Tax=Paraburkholderia tropica TaxID=92647 RepID=UPI0009F54FFB|nr:TonB-dependent receptor [Paraburkholderia tropica]